MSKRLMAMACALTLALLSGPIHAQDSGIPYYAVAHVSASCSNGKYIVFRVNELSYGISRHGVDMILCLSRANDSPTVILCGKATDGAACMTSPDNNMTRNQALTNMLRELNNAGKK